jgi:hypothetical protein
MYSSLSFTVNLLPSWEGEESLALALFGAPSHLVYEISINVNCSSGLMPVMKGPWTYNDHIANCHTKESCISRELNVRSLELRQNGCTEGAFTAVIVASSSLVQNLGPKGEKRKISESRFIFKLDASSSFDMVALNYDGMWYCHQSNRLRMVYWKTEDSRATYHVDSRIYDKLQYLGSYSQCKPRSTSGFPIAESRRGTSISH